MVSKLGVRLLVCAASTAVALGVAILWLRSRRPQSIRLVDNLTGIEVLLRQRERERLEGRVPQPTGKLVREPLDEAAVRMLWSLEAFQEYDPACYFRYEGGLREFLEWPEHPDGRWQFRTSLDGYREDFERLREQRDLLVLVVGDSNTDGLCSNRESFANRLEAALSGRRPSAEIEVLNAGVMGWSFYNYLGELERNLHLRPDAIVVGVYGGNDFLDVVKTWHYFHRTMPPSRTLEYWKRLTPALQHNPVLVGNAFNQLLYFLTFPDQIEIALEACAETGAEIERLCEEHGIRLCYVYIPVYFRLSEPLPPDIETARDRLGISVADLAQFDRLADRLLDGMRARGQRPIDLRQHFGARIAEYYWSDGHIDLEGHALVARLLEGELEAALPAAPGTQALPDEEARRR